jgi:hypothetical protein
VDELEAIDPGCTGEPVLLFTVENVYELRGRGLAIFGAAPAAEKPIPVQGLGIELRQPGGTVIRTTAVAVERAFCRGRDCCVLVPPEVLKEQAPPGTQVWAVN